MNPNPTPANPAQPTPGPETKPETKRPWWRRFWEAERPCKFARNPPPRAVRPFCIPPTSVHVEMPPVKPPAPDRPTAQTFMRYEDASVFNETKPFYVGHKPKPLKPAPGPAAAYVALYPQLVRVAREHGYALAVHGSVQRDFDLVAIPWIQEAAPALTLVKALKAATGGVTTKPEFDELMPDCSPTQKPHGRVGYVIHFTEQGARGPYLDIAVMPRVGSNLPSDEAMMT